MTNNQQLTIIIKITKKSVIKSNKHKNLYLVKTSIKFVALKSKIFQIIGEGREKTLEL